MIKSFIERKQKKKFKRKFKVGLCLSGGGTRGFAHMGAFKAFEEFDIKFDAVAGTSAGSIFGAMYACGLTYEEMFKLTDNIKNSDFRRQKFGFLPSKMEGLQNLLKKVMPVQKIEDMKIPYYAVAVDLKTGKEIHFSSGDIKHIVSGSCAIPGVFLPVKYKGMTLIDGGVSNNIPADVLKMNGCDFVVTVDCNCTRGGGTSSERFFTQFTTSIGIMMVNNSKRGIKCSDIIICPNMKRFSSLKIIRKNDMIMEGYNATKECMPEIIKLFSGKYKKK